MCFANLDVQGVSESRVLRNTFLLFLLWNSVLHAEDWQAALRLKAPKEWKKIEESYRESVIAYTVSKTTGTSEATPVSHVVSFSDGMAKISTGDSSEEVVGMNDEYVFGIRGDEKGDYAVHMLQPKSHESSLERADMEYRRVSCLVAGACWYQGRSLRETFESDRCVVKSVVPIERMGETLVKVDYEWLPPEGANEREKKRAESPAFIIVNPSHCWRLEEYEIVKWWGTIKSELSYGDAHEGLPNLLKKVKALQGDSGPPVTTTVQIKEIQRGPVPKSEFLLSHYGLPEPTNLDGSVGSWFRTPLVLISLAFVLFIASFLIQRQLKKPSSRALPE